MKIQRGNLSRQTQQGTFPLLGGETVKKQSVSHLSAGRCQALEPCRRDIVVTKGWNESVRRLFPVPNAACIVIEKGHLRLQL